MGDVLLQQTFRDLLLRSQNFDTLPVSTAIAERAAEIRALYRLKTPDAIQAATALEAGCNAFLTNNGQDFRRVTILNVLVLDELAL
jgi:predicted nucleic acid-binding protein